MTDDGDRSEHAARGASFASTAEQYERARPGYPQDLLDRVFAEIGLDRARIPDPFEVPYLTEAHWCRKLPQTGS